MREALERGHKQLLAERDATHSAAIDGERAKLEADRQRATDERQAMMTELEAQKAQGLLDEVR